MNHTSSKVELHFCCRGLPNLDTFSLTDAFVVVSLRNNRGQWQETFRTKTIWDSLNPDFADSFEIDYFFEEVQELRFDVYDRDSKKDERLTAHDFVGCFETNLAAIMGSRGQTKQAHLQNNKRAKNGYIIIRGEEMRACSQVLNVQFKGVKLDKKDFFGKSDPFIRVSRSMEDGTSMVVWISEHMKRTLNPVWKPMAISVQTLCNGDIDRPLLVEVFDWNRSGKHDIIGTTQCSVRDLSSGEFSAALVNEKKKKKKKSYKNSGMLHAVNGHLMKVDTFLDYIAGGCEISLSVAIDFTGSNGDPRTPGSLHYRNPRQKNDYQLCIERVGQILLEYDSDKLVPVHGFGGLVNGQTSHCFPLTFDPSNPEVAGIPGIMEVYNNAFNYVGLSGPTLFSQIIGEAVACAPQCTQQDQSYHVLLILTDGIINDMSSTIDTIVQASDHPLSIVIVGIGNANFDAMEVLDADDTPLVDKHGQKMKSDIVQFVPFRDFKDSHFSRLSKETLAEIPGQIISYFKRKGIKPNNRREFVPSASSRSLLAGTHVAGSTRNVIGGAHPQMAQQMSVPQMAVPVVGSQMAATAPLASAPLQQQPSTVPVAASPSPDENTCNICYERPRNAVLIPCGHMGCMTCLHAVGASNPICPICRQRFDRVQQLFG